MPPRHWKFRLQDMLEAITEIEQFTYGLSFDDFQTNSLLIDAVIRNLIVIGEASRHLPADLVRRHPTLPVTEMLGMRNIMVHVYFGVSISVLWGRYRMICRHSN